MINLISIMVNNISLQMTTHKTHYSRHSLSRHGVSRHSLSRHGVSWHSGYVDVLV